MHVLLVAFFVALILLLASIPPAAAERRVALVVGHDAYEHLPSHRQLYNAVNDARAFVDDEWFRSVSLSFAQPAVRRFRRTQTRAHLSKKLITFSTSAFSNSALALAALC